MAAFNFIWRVTNGWATDRPQEVAETERLAWRAVELGRDDAVALSRSGHALAYVVGDLEGGAALIDLALQLNPNYAIAWNASGWVRAYLGETEAAIEHFKHAMRLSPVDPEVNRMQAGMATAHLVAGRHEEAASWAQKALREQPTYPTALRLAAASYALADRPQEASQAVARLRQIDPTLRLSTLAERVPLRKPEHLGRYVEGLRKAGLPE
jgi:tetratricopeptide (TPR) repeat protein